MLALYTASIYPSIGFRVGPDDLRGPSVERSLKSRGDPFRLPSLVISTDRDTGEIPTLPDVSYKFSA